MKYYKIIKDNSFIGVIYSGQFVAQSPNKAKMFYADETTGQFVNYNGTLYRDYWMVEIENPLFPFIFASIVEITEEEYNTLMEAIRQNETINIEEEEEENIEPIVPPIEPTFDETLEFIRSSKIAEMSRACRTTIEGGFDTYIRGETKHFSLDTQDQINLINLGMMAETEEQLPYHADGEDVIFYTAAEIKHIISEANDFKIYQTTYYNALKGYINSLNTIEEISSITYGTPIPEEYKTEVLEEIE